MAMDPATAVLDIGGKLLDKFFPDPIEKAKAKLELAQLSQNGELKEMEVGMSAIVMEAKSQDPWTSRARPSFLYVMYVMILFAIPMGFLYAFSPTTAANVTVGVKGWLEAIPQEMWGLFAVGYLGYVQKRSDDKALMMGHAPQKGLIGKILG